MRSVALVSRAVLFGAMGLMVPSLRADGQLSITTYEADVTPPVGSPLCNGWGSPAKRIVDPLKARGLILTGKDEPIVLCALDWIGLGNDGYDAWRKGLAEAAGTTVDRVAVHCLHQHDAPTCDWSAERLLEQYDLSGFMFDPVFAERAMQKVQAAVREARTRSEPVTHLGIGVAKVEQVASNRRLPGPDGHVRMMRLTVCEDPEGTAAPAGTIDPYLRLVSLWNGERPIASITYFAVHPTSSYGLGAVSTDFVGWARMLRDATLPEIVHIHFNGAGGNIGEGKYNQGLPGQRFALAKRLAQGMEAAWASVKKYPLTAADVDWRVESVRLPARKHGLLDEPQPFVEGEWRMEPLTEAALEAELNDPQATRRMRVRAARDLVWLRRCKAGDALELSCLRIGPACVLHMPGELFVEYQLAAQRMRPDLFVCMAAYGDYGPGYICTSEAYSQRGYEDGRPSRVGPEAEDILITAMARLLGKK